jgi:hypothetical protein
MVPTQPSDTPHAQRLDGWKQIAAYVNRGVRTAQRWERELGMPVHRLNTGGAEVVYALPEELDAWLHRQSRTTLAAAAADETAESNGGSGDGTATGAVVPSPASRSTRVRVLVGLAVVVAAFFAYRIAAPRGPNPVRIEGGGSTLTAFGAQGEVAWTCGFDAPLSETQNRAAWEALTHLADLDGDGINEVVFARTDHADPTVYVLDDGKKRVRHRIGRSVRFGGVPFGPPWHARGVFMAPDGRSFAVASHVTDEFAAVIQEMDVDGHVRGEYWSNGYVSWFSRTTTAGRPVTFVGAINHEPGGASLAIFDGPLRGSAPAVADKYRCSDCPEGRPGVFLIFPRSRLQASEGIGTNMLAVGEMVPHEYSVRLEIGPPPPPGEPTASAYYTIDRKGRVLKTYLGPDALPRHAALVSSGRTTPATLFREEDLWPVRRWNGRGFDVITGPEPRAVR